MVGMNTKSTDDFIYISDMIDMSEMINLEDMAKYEPAYLDLYAEYDINIDENESRRLE
jgi:hypothetical protein